MVVLFFIIYNILILLGIVLLVPGLVIFKPSYMDHALERLGKLPNTNGCIWIHAASVGEVKASAVFINKILSLGHKVVLTTVTPAGREFGLTLKLDNLSVSYLPIDSIFLMLYAFHRTKPRTLIIIETELWPNFLLAAIINRVNIVSVNARLTQKSFKRYMYIHPVTRFLLKRFTFIGAQTAEEQVRFLKLGANVEAVNVTGNIKYSIASNNISSFVQEFRNALVNRKIIIAGSTHNNEERIVLRCFNSIKHRLNNPILILAPRHLSRIPDVEKEIQQANLKYIKRSEIDSGYFISDIDVLLIDTIGELADLYSIGDAIFVGGSMVPVGGHNILEVVIHKKPVIYGKYVDTIKDFVHLLEGSGGIMVNNEQELCEAILAIIEDQQKAQSLGDKAYTLVSEKVNTVNKIMGVLRAKNLL